MKKFNISSNVWRWPGDMGWHFITLDKNVSTKIRKKYTKGFVKIKAKVGKTEWNTSLFPHKETETYLLSIKKSVRKKEAIIENDKVKVSFILL